MGKKTTKTEIVLCNANLTALLSAFEVLDACFGGNLTFRESTVRQANKKSLEYEVDIWGKIPAVNLDGNDPAVFHAIVIFSLRKIAASIDYIQCDPVEIKIFGSEATIKLQRDKDKYIVLEESKQLLENLKKGMRAYFHRTPLL